MNNDDEAQPERPEEQPVGHGTEAAQKMNVASIYPTEFTDNVAIPVPELVKQELDEIAGKKSPSVPRHPFKWIMLAVGILLVAMLFGWAPLNDHIIHTPFDFGPLTAICTLLLVLAIYGFVNLLYRVIRALSKHNKISLVYYVTMPIIALVLLLPAGFFELKHQYVQFLLTPSVRKVSGDPHALARCDRVIANMLGATRYGYVKLGEPVAHFHPTACDEIYDWAVVQGHADTTRSQQHALNTVTHEAVHVGGEMSEFVTTCASYDWDEEILLDLGASPEEAKRLADGNRARHESYHGITPQQKQYEGDCSTAPAPKRAS